MEAARYTVFPFWEIKITTRFLLTSQRFCRLRKGLVGFWKGYYKYARIRRKYPYRM